MSKRIRVRKPSPAMAVALLALFVALGGTALATTQGFILGTTNRVDAASTVTNFKSDGTQNAIGGPLLTLTNGTTASGATALGLNVAANHPPFTTNSGSKVTYLNADRLDNLDSTAFQRRVTGTCGNDSAIQQVNADGSVHCGQFVHGQAQIYTINATSDLGASAQFADVPGEFVMYGFCADTAGGNGSYGFNTHDTSLTVLTDNGGPDPTMLTVAPNTSAGSSFWNSTPTDMHTFSGRTGDASVTIWVSTYQARNPISHTTFCAWQGQILVTNG